MRSPVDERIERLSVISARRVVEPDEALTGTVGAGAVLPPELLSIAGLDVDLAPEQLAQLSREEVASIAAAGIRFEAVLLAGFALQIATAADLTDPRVTYVLHELGEETRHSRVFVRLIEQLQPQARSPIEHRLFRAVEGFVVRRLIRHQALFCVLVLTGEEIPDLLQKLASEHPDTDPFLAEVNRYHRQEEARHIAFARAILPEVWDRAGAIERAVVAHAAPVLIRGMFEALVHPGVYAAVGLPGWRTWRAANRTPQRIALRHQALRPLLRALLDAGAFRPGCVPKAWQRLCGVDRSGEPRPDADPAGA